MKSAKNPRALASATASPAGNMESEDDDEPPGAREARADWVVLWVVVLGAWLCWATYYVALAGRVM